MKLLHTQLWPLGLSLSPREDGLENSFRTGSVRCDNALLSLFSGCDLQLEDQRVDWLK